MAQNGVSLAVRLDQPQPADAFTASGHDVHKPDSGNWRAALPAFATRAQARLLDALGWRLSASPRRESDWHEPLQCCFILRDGRREEAAFGYTAMTAPDDTDCPNLRMAKSRVECHLAWLGEDSGVLVQNRPVFAFCERRRDRIVLFGGWRRRRGTWTPFLLGPEGLAGVDGQDLLFARGTDPHHMVEICGHATRDVAPRIVELVHAINSLDQRGDGAGDAAGPVPDFDELRIEPLFSGWFTARVGKPAGVTPIRPVENSVPVFRHTETALLGQAEARAGEQADSLVFRHTSVPGPGRTHAPGATRGDVPVFRHATPAASAGNGLWASESDEFRFHKFGMDRG